MGLGRERSYCLDYLVAEVFLICGRKSKPTKKVNAAVAYKNFAI
jgi:hypothetical protein